MTEDIAESVLARPEIVEYLRDAEADGDALTTRARVYAYLEELRTTQRPAFYRALQHPLYPILRKIEKVPEGIDHVQAAVAAHRVMYASNHRSHTDYLVQPIVLDDHGIRPPLIAAGINLFGGPLGLIHRHVTGAIPIRRSMKDPAYLITLKAYIAELLQRQDVFFYPEGGRSYSGELKPAKTGLINAALAARRQDLVVIPTAIAYDFVLEDHILARQKTKKRQRPFSHEVAEMARFAVGYRSRAIVTFGAPIAMQSFDAESRSDAVELTRLLRAHIGAQVKVVPTSLFCAAMRPSIGRDALVDRIDRLVATVAAQPSNLDLTRGADVVDAAAEALDARGIIAIEDGHFRVRERHVLRYYARTIEHLTGPVPRDF